MKRDSESEKEETVDNAEKKNFRKGYRSWGEIEEKNMGGKREEKS